MRIGMHIQVNYSHLSLTQSTLLATDWGLRIMREKRVKDYGMTISINMSLMELTCFTTYVAKYASSYLTVPTSLTNDMWQLKIGKYIISSLLYGWRRQEVMVKENIQWEKTCIVEQYWRLNCSVDSWGITYDVPADWLEIFSECIRHVACNFGQAEFRFNLISPNQCPFCNKWPTKKKKKW